MITQHPDYENGKGYAGAWGFRPGSQIALLIEYIREENRAKYGCDYRLQRTGKNKFVAVPGDRSDYGVKYAVAASAKFKTRVVAEITK